MAGPQTLAQSHPESVWGALVGSLAIISALVAVLYNRLNRDINAHDESLRAGQKVFEEIGKQLVTIGKDIERLSKSDSGDKSEFASLQRQVDSLHDTLLIIATKHNHNHPGDKVQLLSGGE